MGPELKEGELLKVNMQGMAFRPSVIVRASSLYLPFYSCI